MSKVQEVQKRHIQEGLSLLQVVSVWTVYGVHMQRLSCWWDTLDNVLRKFQTIVFDNKSASLAKLTRKCLIYTLPQVCHHLDQKMSYLYFIPILSST